MTVQEALISTQQDLVSCHVCSSREYVLYIAARGHSIVRCNTCGLIYVNPQPSSEELEGIYSAYDSGDQWRSGEEHFNRTVTRTILRFKRRGAALDLGCGSGNFLRCLRTAEFQVFGVEPSRTGSEYTKSVHGIEVFQGTIESYLVSDLAQCRHFDVVTLLNVLEHLKDPSNALRKLHHVTNENGILVIVVPDARLHALIGEVRRTLGFKDPFWMDTVRHPLVAIDPPHHLCSFEPRTISELLLRCGFRSVYVRNAPVVFNDDRWKNVAKVLLHAASEALYWLTFRRLVLGYSTLIVCQKA